MLFFDENPIPPASLENYETVPDKWYKYLTKTDRVLRMNRIFVDAKSQASSSKGVESSINNDQTAMRMDSDMLNVEAPTAASKDDAAESATTAVAAAESRHIPITKSYAMALSQFLKPGEQAPRAADMADEEFFRKFGTLEATLGEGEASQEGRAADNEANA